MKKYAIIFSIVAVLVFVIQSVSFSSATYAPNSCYTGEYPIGNSVSRGFQKVFGISFVTRKSAESIIEGQIKKLIDKGNVDVKLKSYGAGDLLAGKIKDFQIQGKNIESNGIFISKIEAKSLCDFTWFAYKSSPAELKSPLYARYNAEITEEAFKNIFAAETTKEALTGIKIMVSNINFGQVDFVNIKPDISGSKIKLKANLVYKKAPFSLTFPINLETAIKVKNDKVMLTNLKFPSNSVDDEFRFITSSLELNNIPLFDLKILETEGADINIKKLEVANDKISLDGTIWLPQELKL